MMEMTLLADAATFEDAPCVGRWVLFDETGPDEPPRDAVRRHTVAAQLCSTCPCLAPCEALRRDQPVGKPTGVWAGRLRHGGTQAVAP